jgi:hypothetical protein
MSRRSPSENAHRIASSRPPDLSGHVDGSKAASSIPVGDFLAGSDATPDTPPGSPHPFGDNAVRLLALGLVIVPCGGDDGKRPLVNGWQRPERAKPGATWARRFAAANIGVACGASGICATPTVRTRSTVAAPSPRCSGRWATPTWRPRAAICTHGPTPRAGSSWTRGFFADVTRPTGVAVLVSDQRRDFC